MTADPNLLADIERVFPQTPLSFATAFLSWGATYPSAEDVIAWVDGRTWAELESDRLIVRSDALGFLDPAALAGILPAYLRMLLDDAHLGAGFPASVAMALDPTYRPDQDSRARFEALLGHLDTEQRAVVARCLVSFRDRFGDDFGAGRCVRRALKNFAEP